MPILFETSMLFGLNKIEVYEDHVEYEKGTYLKERQSIFLDQITGVEMGNQFEGKIEIRTASGEKHVLRMKPKDKRGLVDAIHAAKAKLKKG